jgi:hypothetical protein
MNAYALAIGDACINWANALATNDELIALTLLVDVVGVALA